MSRQKFPGWTLQEDGYLDEADDMCPNCITPWKCNGPHLVDETPYMQRLLDANRRSPRRGCLYWVLACVVVLASLTNPVPLTDTIPREVQPVEGPRNPQRQVALVTAGLLGASSLSATRGDAPTPSGEAGPVPLRAEEPPVNVVGPASYTASATWCAPTPTQCQSWGGNARLAAVNSFRFGDEPYPVRVWRGEQYVDVTVVSFCACHGQHGYIDLSPAAFEVLAPLSRGRIDVSVEVLVDLPPHPDDERMRAEDGPQVTTPPTDTVPS